MARAQASVEYLVILAAVVIISLAVVGVLTGFPALTRGIFPKSSLAYWQSADIGIEKPYMSSSATAGTSKIVVRNNRNFPVTVSTLTFGGTNVVYGGLPVTLSPGEMSVVSLIAQNPCSSSGRTFSVSATIGYSDASSGSSYTLIGAQPIIDMCN